MHSNNAKRRSRLKDKFLVVVLATIICLVVASPFAFVSAYDFSQGLNNFASRSGFLPHQGREWALPYIIGNIIYAALSLVGVVFLIVAIVAGYRWMMAGGNEETLSNAKKTLSRAVTGVVVIMISYAITYYVVKALS